MSDTPFNNLTFDMPKSQSNTIKVIGVGGGGSNAVNHMFSQDVKGVDFVICNTDAQALQNSPIPNKIQLGVSLTSGLGAGANPEVGGKAAKESIDDIKKMLTPSTKMVFITAGMGGGTGTGAAPIIAGIAKEMDILTVGVVTMPFQFEGRMRSKQAQKGIDELRDNVDSLIVINNNKLREVYGNLGFKAGFSKADEVLSTASRGIAEVITHHYKQNIDLHDAKTVLSNSGTAIMGSSKEAGENRAKNAIIKALDSPLLNDNKITGAKNVLLLIVSGEEEVTLDEIGQINDYIQDEAGYDANIIMGVGEDEELGDAIAVTVVATGFAVDQQKDITNTEVKKVYHTLNTEQTAHYNFDDEDQPIQRSRMTRPLDEIPTPVQEQKVVHQLLEEDESDFFKPIVPKKIAENELTEAAPDIESIEVVFEEVDSISEEISEDDFIINDITPDLFSVADEGEKPTINVFDLPVTDVKEAKLEEASKIVDFSDISEDEVVFERKEIKEPDNAKRTVFVLEDEEDSIEAKKIIDKVKESEPTFTTEVSSTGIKRYTLDDFDPQPTIKNSSSLSFSKKSEHIVVNEEEDIKLREEPITFKAVEKEEVREDEAISPLNLTISELQKSAEKRKNTFKKYSHRFKNAAFNEDVIDDIEKVPAYKRLGLELHNKQDVDHKSRSSIDVSNNEVTIRKNNSFLHDNVD